MKEEVGEGGVAAGCVCVCVDGEKAKKNREEKDEKMPYLAGYTPTPRTSGREQRFCLFSDFFKITFLSLFLKTIKIEKYKKIV